MSDWLLNLPVLWMGVVILGFIYLGTAGIYLLITKLAVGDRLKAFKAITPGILPPLSVVFGLLVAFLANQVWGEADKASTAVNREASALRAVVLLASQFPGETETHLRGLIHDYIQDAANQEWPDMARHHVTLTIAPPKLAERCGWRCHSHRNRWVRVDAPARDGCRAPERPGCAPPAHRLEWIVD
jgi:hypothetical protein